MIVPFEFQFNTATLVRQNGEWEVQHQSKHAYYFVQMLPGDVPLEMVAIPRGTFLMGSPEGEPQRDNSESPQHEVSVEPFFLGRSPVTQKQWRAVAELPQIERRLNPDPARFKGDDRPVEQVSWLDAVEFCLRLSEFTGRSYCLPSEAQREYACRAGTTTPFYFGETISTELANYNGNHTYADETKGRYRKGTTPVYHFGIANAFGLSDMHGNVWEWCADRWHSNYKGAPVDGTAWLSDDGMNSRVMRGGGWFLGPGYCRSARRFALRPDCRSLFVGFRLSHPAPHFFS